MADATIVGSTENGKQRIYEITNTKNKKIKFQIVLGDPEYRYWYIYSISVNKPPTDN
jgi:hypothetical protein